MNKGQGALEYLLLIGGAVLVAIIAIALVFGIGETAGEQAELNEQSAFEAAQRLRDETAAGTGETPEEPATTGEASFFDSVGTELTNNTTVKGLDTDGDNAIDEKSFTVNYAEQSEITEIILKSTPRTLCSGVSECSQFCTTENQLEFKCRVTGIEVGSHEFLVTSKRITQTETKISTLIFNAETTDNLCEVTPETKGNCKRLFYLPYFNQTTGTCETYQTGGCEATVQPFQTEEECQTICEETQGTAQNKKVLMLVESRDYDSLKQGIDYFKNDILAYFNIEVKVIPLDLSHENTAPEEIRLLLQQECGEINNNGCENIEGAIFVGTYKDGSSLPYKFFKSPYDDSAVAPFMFYYQDLDGSFEQDDEGNYIGYQSIGDYPGPEIYVSWILPIFDDSYGTSIEQLNRYFEKHHAYFSGLTESNNGALYAIHVPNMVLDETLISLQEQYGEENVVHLEPEVTDDLCPLKTILTSELENKPEIAVVFSHGSPNGQWCLTKEDFGNFDNQPLLILAGGCSSGNISGDYASVSFPLAFINSSDLGLTFVGLLHSTDVNHGAIDFFENEWWPRQIDDFLKLWGEGEQVGRIFLKSQKEYSTHYNLNNENFYEVNGPLQRVIIGSPFIYSKSS